MADQVLDRSERYVTLYQELASGTSVTWSLGGQWPVLPGIYETDTKNGHIIFADKLGNRVQTDDRGLPLRDDAVPVPRQEPFTVDTITLIRRDGDGPYYFEVVGHPFPGTPPAEAQIVAKEELPYETVKRSVKVLSSETWDRQATERWQRGIDVGDEVVYQNATWTVEAIDFDDEKDEETLTLERDGAAPLKMTDRYGLYKPKVA